MKLNFKFNDNATWLKTATSKGFHKIRVWCSDLEPVLKTVLSVSQIFLVLNQLVPQIIPQPDCNPTPAQQEQVKPTPAQQEEITS